MYQEMEIVPRLQKGFTLIEILVVVAIIAILAAIAYPAYGRHVIKANRAAAQAAMLDIATRQQQFLMANRAYADTSTLSGSGYSLPTSISSIYSYAVTVTTSTSTLPSFLITFTPSGSQASDGTMTLSSEGEKLPASKW